MAINQGLTEQFYPHSSTMQSLESQLLTRDIKATFRTFETASTSTTATCWLELEEADLQALGRSFQPLVLPHSHIPLLLFFHHTQTIGATTAVMATTAPLPAAMRSHDSLDSI